ncbi:MAG: hypothetical protein WC889_20295 [Myxococcota bacterium]|jgi:hypothetical protein
MKVFKHTTPAIVLSACLLASFLCAYAGEKAPPVGKDTDAGVKVEKAEDRPTSWLGRSIVVGQCERGQGNQKSGSGAAKSPGAATVLEMGESVPVKTGSKFQAWVKEWQEATYKRNPGTFQCEACHVCKDFSMEYIRVYRADEGKFPEYRRVED